MLGETLIDEGVIRRQQIIDAAVLLDDAGEEQLDFALEASRSVLSKSGKMFTAGSVAAMPRMFNHWPVKFCTSACERGSAIMRSTCCLSTFGSCSLLAEASVINSLSGMLLHRKNDRRDASSRSLMW